MMTVEVNVSGRTLTGEEERDLADHLRLPAAGVR
jgi:hypothetical protein